jgi:hypothetical protein
MGRRGSANGMRISPRFLTAWVIGLGSAIMLLGAPTAARAADLAHDLARLHVEAIGGPKAVGKLRAFSMEGVTRIGGQELNFILWAARPNLVRIETVTPDGTLVRAFDGVHAPWKRLRADGLPRRLSVAEEHDFVLDADFDSLLYQPEKRDITLEYGGEVREGERVFHRILASRDVSETFFVFIDNDTYDLVMRQGTRNGPGGRAVAVLTLYGNHREVAGVRLPHNIRTVIAGKLAHESVVRRYTANPDLPTDFFTPPAEDWPKW